MTSKDKDTQDKHPRKLPVVRPEDARTPLERLRLLRTLSRKTVIDGAGVSAGTLARAEEGWPVREEVADKLAAYYDVPREEIIPDEAIVFLTEEARANRRRTRRQKSEPRPLSMIEELLIDRGLQPRDVEKAQGAISHSTVERVARGEWVKPKTADKLAAFFGIPTDQLFDPPRANGDRRVRRTNS